MGEPGTTERTPRPIGQIVKEFISSLPPEGLIIHGTLNKSIRAIKERGLEPPMGAFGSLNIHFFSFNPPDSNDLSSIKDELRRFRKSIKESVFWAGIHSSLYEIDPEDIAEDNLPAIVVAKRPTKSSDSNRLSVYGDVLRHEHSADSIPPEDILAIASLTPEEYKDAVQRFKAPNGTETLNGEVGKILDKKILKSLIERAGRFPSKEKQQVESVFDQ